MECKHESLSHLKVFGYLSYVHVDVGSMSKLDLKSIKCKFVGYELDEFRYKF